MYGMNYVDSRQQGTRSEPRRMADSELSSNDPLRFFGFGFNSPTLLKLHHTSMLEGKASIDSPQSDFHSSISS